MMVGGVIILIMGLLVSGFCLFIHTFENSARFDPDTGALYIGLSCCLVAGGALLGLAYFAGF